MIIKSQYQMTEPEPSSDVTRTLLDRALQYKNKVALIDSVTKSQYTYAELGLRVRQIAQSLHEAYGLLKGDVTLLLSPNCLEYVLFMFGAMAIGVVVSTGDPTYAVAEAEHHLRDCGALFLVTSPDLVPKMQQACANNDDIKGIFVFGDAPGCISYSDLLNCSGDCIPNVSINIKEDLAILPYSSGTTGTPKGVMLTHFNMLYSMQQCTHSEIGFYTSTDEERVLLVLPMYFIFGISVIATSLKEGNTVVAMPKYELTSFLENIRLFKPTFVPVRLPIVVQLTKSAEVNPDIISSVNKWCYGGAPIGPDIEKEWDKKFPYCRRAQGLGMTELAGTSVISPWKEVVPYGSVGPLLPGYEARIVYPDSEQDAPLENTGELWVRSKNVMRGYFRKPERTTATIRSDGWMKTGDLVRIDRNGLVYVVGRLKEMIKCMTFQIAPAELENVLLKHPSVADCAVVGLPDVSAGELPRAYIVLKPGQFASHKEIQELVAENVGPTKRLTGGVIFVDSIPRSPSGKTLRRILRDHINME